MKDIDFNSEEWKERFKGKSPEEIAKIVEDYYKEKYREGKNYWGWRIGGLVFFLVILVFIFIILYHLLENFAQ